MPSTYISKTALQHPLSSGVILKGFTYCKEGSHTEDMPVVKPPYLQIPLLLLLFLLRKASHTHSWGLRHSHTCSKALWSHFQASCSCSKINMRPENTQSKDLILVSQIWKHCHAKIIQILGSTWHGEYSSTKQEVQKAWFLLEIYIYIWIFLSLLCISGSASSTRRTLCSEKECCFSSDAKIITIGWLS